MNRLTKDQAAVVTAYTGILAGPFPTFHEYAERILDRPIMSHEFADKELWSELKEAARPDFVSICYSEEDDG